MRRKEKTITKNDFHTIFVFWYDDLLFFNKESHSLEGHAHTLQQASIEQQEDAVVDGDL